MMPPTILFGPKVPQGENHSYDDGHREKGKQHGDNPQRIASPWLGRTPASLVPNGGADVTGTAAGVVQTDAGPGAPWSRSSTRLPPAVFTRAMWGEHGDVVSRGAGRRKA